MTADPLAIYQGVLDNTSAALIARDDAAFLRHIIYPHTLVTETQTLHIPDRATALHHFLRFSDSLAALGITEYIRIADHAAFDGPDKIAGRHKSHLIRGAVRAVPPFNNEITLERIEGGLWGVRVSRHKAAYVAWPDILPTSPTGGSDAKN